MNSLFCWLEFQRTQCSRNTKLIAHDSKRQMYSMYIIYNYTPRSFPLLRGDTGNSNRGGTGRDGSNIRRV